MICVIKLKTVINSFREGCLRYKLQSKTPHPTLTSDLFYLYLEIEIHGEMQMQQKVPTKKA